MTDRKPPGPPESLRKKKVYDECSVSSFRSDNVTAGSMLDEHVLVKNVQDLTFTLLGQHIDSPRILKNTFPFRDCKSATLLTLFF